MDCEALVPCVTDCSWCDLVSSVLRPSAFGRFAVAVAAEVVSEYLFKEY